jgi:hypothetical protein
MKILLYLCIIAHTIISINSIAIKRLSKDILYANPTLRGSPGTPLRSFSNINKTKGLFFINNELQKITLENYKEKIKENNLSENSIKDYLDTIIKEKYGSNSDYKMPANVDEMINIRYKELEKQLIELVKEKIPDVLKNLSLKEIVTMGEYNFLTTIDEYFKANNISVNEYTNIKEIQEMYNHELELFNNKKKSDTIGVINFIKQELSQLKLENYKEKKQKSYLSQYRMSNYLHTKIKEKYGIDANYEMSINLDEMINMRFKELEKQSVELVKEKIPDVLKNLSPAEIVTMSENNFIKKIYEYFKANNIPVDRYRDIKEIKKIFDDQKKAFNKEKLTFTGKIRPVLILIAFGGLIYKITQDKFDQIKQLFQEGKKEEIKKLLDSPIGKDVLNNDVDKLIVIQDDSDLTKNNNLNEEKNELVKQDISQDRDNQITNQSELEGGKTYNITNSQIQKQDILSDVETIEKDPLVAVSAVPIIFNAGEGNQEKNEPIKEDPKARNFSNTWKDYITTKNTLLALGITAGVIYTRKKVISWWDNKNKRNKKKSNNS